MASLHSAELEQLLSRRVAASPAFAIAPEIYREEGRETRRPAVHPPSRWCRPSQAHEEHGHWRLNASARAPAPHCGET